MTGPVSVVGREAFHGRTDERVLRPPGQFPYGAACRSYRSEPFLSTTPRAA